MIAFEFVSIPQERKSLFLQVFIILTCFFKWFSTKSSALEALSMPSVTVIFRTASPIVFKAFKRAAVYFLSFTLFKTIGSIKAATTPIMPSVIRTSARVNAFLSLRAERSNPAFEFKLTPSE